MKQGEIWDVNFNPSKGSEQHGIRPSVIMSGNVMNNNFDLVIVCPITSKIKNLRGNLVLNASEKNGLKKKSEILIFQIRSISKERLMRKRGRITVDELDYLKNNLNKILNYYFSLRPLISRLCRQFLPITTPNQR